MRFLSENRGYMDKQRLQFWDALRDISTFSYLVFGSLAALDIAGLMPKKFEQLLDSLFFFWFPRYLPAQLKQIWIPLLIVAAMFLFIVYVADRRKRLWQPSRFDELPAPGGGYLRKVGIAPFKEDLKRGEQPARRPAKESFKLAELHFAENRYKEAVAEYQKSVFSMSTKSAYLNLGVSLWYTSYFQRAMDAFEKGLSIARKDEDGEFETAFLSNIGVLQRERGKLDEALAHFKRVYGIYGETGDVLGQACALGNIGSVYLLQGRTDEAMKSWEMAHERFEKAGHAASRATALDNIGSVYGGKWNFGRALKYHRKAHRIFKGIPNLPGETQTLANIGFACFKLGRWRRSLKASHAALRRAEQLGSSLDRAKALGAIGLVHEKGGRLEDALVVTQESLELYRQLDNPVGVGNQLANVGVIYAAQDKKNEALLKWGEARSKFLTTGARSYGYHILEAAIEQSLHD